MEVYSVENGEGCDTMTKSRYRELLSILIANPPKSIVIGGLDDKGDMQFSISMKDLGMSYNDYKFYENELFSNFIIDFLGELIVRENLNKFFLKMNGYGFEEYSSVIERYGIHKRFGIRATKSRLVFKFHISFIKNILNESMREII